MKKIVYIFIFLFFASIVCAQETVNVSFQSIDVNEDYYIVVAGPAIPHFFIDGKEVEIVKTEKAGGALYAFYYLERVEGKELTITHDEEENYIYLPQTVILPEFFPEELCTDLDGVDYFTKGKVIIDPYFDGKEFVLEDNCGKKEYEGYVIEYTCDLNEQGDTYVPLHFKCDYGCDDGACKKNGCLDSDEGDNIDEKGNLINGPGNNFTDFCKDKNYLMEYSCYGLEGHQANTHFCFNGCENGACKNVKSPYISMNECLDNPDKYWDQETDACYDYFPNMISQLCNDPDGGKNPFVQAHTFGFRSYSSAEDPSKDLRIRTGGKDGCIDENTLREHYCSEEGYITTIFITCESGCYGGECLDEGLDGSFKTVDEVDEVPYVELDPNTMPCSGCLNEKKLCIPFGTRTDSRYCGLNGSFKLQKSDEGSCNNNYECSSNVCVNDACISPTFIQKIVLWLQRIFA